MAWFFFSSVRRHGGVVFLFFGAAPRRGCVCVCERACVRVGVRVRVCSPLPRLRAVQDFLDWQAAGGLTQV